MKIPVLLPNIFNHPFTYDDRGLNLKKGDYVEIPFGKKNKIGVVWDDFEKDTNKNFSIKPVTRKLKIPSEKVISNINKHGNTSAASIPLALDEAVRSGKIKSGDIVASSGFGAGLTWGAVIFRWTVEV